MSTFAVIGQTTSVVIQIKTDSVLLNNYQLKDSINLNLLKKTIGEEPKISYFLSKHGKDKLVDAKTSKVLWQKIEFKNYGIELYRIEDDAQQKQKSNFAYLQFFPNKTTILKLNSDTLDISSLTCIKVDSLIKTEFIDNF